MNISKIKEAQTKYHLIDLIKNRWSPRAFSDKKVTKESLQRLATTKCNFEDGE